MQVLNNFGEDGNEVEKCRERLTSIVRGDKRLQLTRKKKKSTTVQYRTIVTRDFSTKTK